MPNTVTSNFLSGDIEGVPRVLDAGQCNDSYSLVRIALALKDALKVPSVNDLPIVYNIAWYEQKAVIVLLALLSFGVQNIHTGPTLPAFFTPDILKVLQEKFNIGTISTVEDDIKTSLTNKLTIMDKYVCEVCDWVYDPATGDPENGIAPERNLMTFPTTGYVLYVE